MFTVLDGRKQAKLQWVQDPRQRNLDNVNTVRIDNIRQFKVEIEGISES
jgi:hypothetical protein